MSDVVIRALCCGDQEWVKKLIEEHWGSETVVAHGRVYKPHTLPGFAAFLHEGIVGLVTYQLQGEDCEIITLNSLKPGMGIGTALIVSVTQVAMDAGCKRLWLITTNDNITALRFYQKRGFEIVAVHRHALAQSRKLKPGIPEIGEFGIPLRDEIEFELPLSSGKDQE